MVSTKKLLHYFLNSMSLKEFRALLEDEMFTDEEIEYAVKHVLD